MQTGKLFYHAHLGFATHSSYFSKRKNLSSRIVINSPMVRGVVNQIDISSG
jgi:hypothetical protein